MESAGRVNADSAAGRDSTAGSDDLDPGSSLRTWLARTPNRTFALYPALVIGGWLLEGRRRPRTDLRFAPLLAWGYAQYRLVGAYRVALGGGGPGIQVPPERLVTTGPYRYTRNPMYLGHLVFLVGLVLTFPTRLAALLLAANVAWFQQRVFEDEERLTARFGAPYEAYRARVRRWIPGVL